MKKITCSVTLLLTLFLFAAQLCSAQTGVVAYKETTLYSQEFKHIMRTSDGGMVGVGSLGYGGRVMKVDASLNQVWSFAIDSIVLRDAIETNDGNYLLMGHALTSDYNGAVYVIKITPAGTTLFEKMYYSNIVNQLTADGICKAAGSTDNGFVLHGGNCIAMHYVMKCDVNGNIVWQKQHVGLGNGTYVSMLSESAGYVAAFNVSGASYPSVGIVKMDVNGDVTACKTYEGTNMASPYSHSLVKKNSGEYVMWAAPGDTYGAQIYTASNSLSTVSCSRLTSGTMMYFTSIAATGNATDDLILVGGYSSGYAMYVKVNPAGSIIYQKEATPSYPSYFNSAVPMGGGRYALGGSRGSTGKIIAMVDETGAGVCSTVNLTLGTASYPLTSGTRTITNYTVGALSGPGIFPLYPATDVTTTLCGSLSSNNDISEETPEVLVYPNPASSSVNIDVQSKESGKANVRILDITGRLVLSTQMEISQGTSTLNVNTEMLAPGIYSLQLQVNESTHFAVQKIIKL